MKKLVSIFAVCTLLSSCNHETFRNDRSTAAKTQQELWNAIPYITRDNRKACATSYYIQNGFSVLARKNATGNIEYIVESNRVRRIGEQWKIFAGNEYFSTFDKRFNENESARIVQAAAKVDAVYIYWVESRNNMGARTPKISNIMNMSGFNEKLAECNNKL